MFPEDCSSCWKEEGDLDVDRQFSEGEVSKALRMLKRGKGPSLDGILAEAIQKAYRAIPHQIRHTLNELPRSWKIVKVVLLPTGEWEEDPFHRCLDLCALEEVVRMMRESSTTWAVLLIRRVMGVSSQS